MFGKMKDKIKGKVSNQVKGTDAYKNFEQSEDYQKLRQFQKEYKEFKGDVKE
jgi:hypothetical protein